MATSSTRCESPGVDPWTCMPKHTNPQRDMLEHPIFALPHNRIHPYSDDALAALGRTPTLEAGRKSAGRPQLGPNAPDCGRRRKAPDAPTPTVPERKMRTRKIDPLRTFSMVQN